jgi:hypothetical protein
MKCLGAIVAMCLVSVVGCGGLDESATTAAQQMPSIHCQKWRPGDLGPRESQFSGKSLAAPDRICRVKHPAQALIRYVEWGGNWYRVVPGGQLKRTVPPHFE